jgi:uncharacterized protein involved in outer membrane biogenesis
MANAASRSQSTAPHKRSFGKLLRWVVLGLIGFLVLIFLGRNIIIKTAIQIGVQKALGMKVNIAGFSLDFFPGKLEIKELTVYNPPGFEGEALTRIPYIRADFDLATLLAGNFHFKYLDLNIEEVNLVKNRNKELNLNRIQTIAQAGSKSPPQTPANTKPASIRINELILTINHVNYIDYSKDHPKQQRIRLGIYRERFTNLRGVDDIVKIVVVRIVYKAGLYNLGLPFRALSSEISHIGNSIGNSLNKTGKQVDKFFNHLFKKK